MTTAVFPVLPVTSAAVSSVPNVLATHTSCLSPLFCREHSAFVFQTSKNPPPFGKPAAEQRIGIRASQGTRDACEVGAHMRSESGGEGTGGPTLRAPLPKWSCIGQGRADLIGQSQAWVKMATLRSMALRRALDLREKTNSSTRISGSGHATHSRYGAELFAYSWAPVPLCRWPLLEEI